MATTRVLALDFGSSSVRAVVCEGERLEPGAVARRAVHREATDDEAAATLDAEAYFADLVACLDELADSGALDGVEQVAVCSQWHSVLAADPRGRPLSDAVTWADTRAQAPRGRGPADPEEFHRRTGTWHHRLYWTVRVPWLRAELQQEAAWYLGLPDHIWWRLTGERVTSPSVASGTGLLDLTACGWDAEALELAGLTADRLPAIAAQGATGRLLPEWRTRWPALAEVEWHPAVGDGAASNVGVGATHPGVASVTVGTSAAIRVVHPVEGAPPLDPALWRYRVDDERLVTGAAFSVGGNVYAWLRRLLGDEALRRGPAVQPGDSGLLVVPLHAGTRPPETVPAGSGAILGLSLDTTADEVLAASLEGVSLEAARALHTLESSFRSPLEVVLGGGAVDASPWWRTAFSAAMDRDVLVSDDREVGARGAAAIALGVDPQPPGDRVAADEPSRERLRRLGQRYDEVRRCVVDTALPG
jgi:gluconokinase